MLFHQLGGGAHTGVYVAQAIGAFPARPKAGEALAFSRLEPGTSAGSAGTATLSRQPKPPARAGGERSSLILVVSFELGFVRGD
jgi:hypothetical protein